MDLLELTPEQLAMTPAGMPPPGVMSNLEHPHSRGHIMIIVGTIMMVFMFVPAGLRYYTKIWIVRKTTWDDYTCGIAIFGTILYFIACCYAVTEGKIGTHLWDISLAHLLSEKFQVSGFLINFVSAIVWPFAKMSFFLLYLQLFRPLTWLCRMIYFGMFVNIGFYLSIVAATLYYTAPAPGESWAETYLSSRYAGALKMTIPIASGSLVIDVYIFLMPIFGIYNLKLSTRKKLGIMVIFATGLMACIASSLSIYYKHVLDNHLEDFTWTVLPVTLMALVEMCIGIAASCMPALANMVRNGEEWVAIRSKLSATFSSLTSWTRISKSASVNNSKFADTTSLNKPCNRQYSSIEEPQNYEMKRVRGVSTYIRHGRPASGNDDTDGEGIYLKHSIQQEVFNHDGLEARNRTSPV